MCIQWRLGIHPVWSEYLLCAQLVAKDPGFLHVDSEDWSDRADAQADLSLRWAHRSFCLFCLDVAHFSNFRIITEIFRVYKFFWLLWYMNPLIFRFKCFCYACHTRISYTRSKVAKHAQSSYTTSIYIMQAFLRVTAAYRLSEMV